MEVAEDLCEGRLTLVHEGGYSEVYVPFCGHGVLQELSQSVIGAADPMAQTLSLRQPSQRFDNFVSSLIGEMEDLFL
jgi:acetoin utilization deacetylase AcuC-like enzyme